MKENLCVFHKLIYPVNEDRLEMKKKKHTFLFKCIIPSCYFKMFLVLGVIHHKFIIITITACAINVSKNNKLNGLFCI